MSWIHLDLLEGQRLKVPPFIKPPLAVKPVTTTAAVYNAKWRTD